MNSRAYRFDLDWTNPQLLFTISGQQNDYVGITYDPSNDSLWLSGWDLDIVENRSIDGALLSSFTVGHSQSFALALDYADGTLWLHDRNAGRFEQWSRDGNLLDTLTLPGVGRAYGGEFQFQIPAPGAALLAALGFALVGWVKRRKA